MPHFVTFLSVNKSVCRLNDLKETQLVMRKNIQTTVGFESSPENCNALKGPNIQYMWQDMKPNDKTAFF